MSYMYSYRADVLSTPKSHVQCTHVACISCMFSLTFSFLNFPLSFFPQALHLLQQAIARGSISLVVMSQAAQTVQELKDVQQQQHKKKGSPRKRDMNEKRMRIRSEGVQIRKVWLVCVRVCVCQLHMTVIFKYLKCSLMCSEEEGIVILKNLGII